MNKIISRVLNLGKIKFNFCNKNISRSAVSTAFPSLEDKAGEACSVRSFKGLVLGIYTNPDDPVDKGVLTSTGKKYNENVNNRVMQLLKFVGPPPGKGVVRIFYDVCENFDAVAVVGIGRQCQGYDVFEQIDEGKEAIRIAAASGCQALQELHLRKICIESFEHSESAAEGAALGVWLYQEKKSRKNQLPIPLLELHDSCDWVGWQIGLQKAAAQNLARQLMDTPSNLMTPTSFAQNAVEILCKSGVNVEVKVRGWAETNNMNSFLAISAGSCEPPIFLEISYYGTSKDERPIVLIGKGVTYNSGGLCLRPVAHQQLMRGEMSGAAIVVATCRAAAGLRLPVNIRGLIPLCENMPGCAALKPGNVIKCRNGKSLFIETTKCAGRLALVDTVYYAQSFWPKFILNVGAISSCTMKSFGQACSVVCTNSEALWEYMLAASMHTGDRVWRMPLWKHFTQLLTANHECDVKMNGRARVTDSHYGGPCKVAAFINAFMPPGDWLHLDTMGVMYSTGIDYPYLREGMSGRPTRTIVEFLSQLVCHNNEASK